MYYSIILQSIASLTNVIGTIYAVFSILKIRFEDLYKSITLEGMDKNDKTLLTQRNQARIGIGFVVYAWILQVIFSILQVTSCNIFIACLISYIIITMAICLILHLINKRFIKKYELFKEKNDKDTHLDSHMWGELDD